MRTVGHPPGSATIAVTDSLTPYKVLGKESDALARYVESAVQPLGMREEGIFNVH